MKYGFVFFFLFCVCLVSVFVACGGPKKKEPGPSVIPKGDLGSYVSSPNGSGKSNALDLRALEGELLGKETSSDLGYVEKPFNACQVRANRSAHPDCQDLFFGRLQFHMTCRNNFGIVRSSQLLPLKLSGVRWRAGRDGGGFSTDSQGRGVIHFVSKKTARFRPMKFYIGQKIVYKRLKDNWKIVLPRDWCPAEAL